MIQVQEVKKRAVDSAVRRAVVGKVVQKVVRRAGGGGSVVESRKARVCRRGSAKVWWWCSRVCVCRYVQWGVIISGRDPIIMRVSLFPQIFFTAL